MNYRLWSCGSALMAFVLRLRRLAGIRVSHAGVVRDYIELYTLSIEIRCKYEHKYYAQGVDTPRSFYLREW